MTKVGAGGLDMPLTELAGREHSQETTQSISSVLELQNRTYELSHYSFKGRIGSVLFKPGFGKTGVMAIYDPNLILVLAR